MSKPEIRGGSRLLPGLIAVALFGVLAWVFLTASFEPPAGFEGSVVEGIGYALLNITVDGVPYSEGFLAAFILIALVLDAALDGAIMLARRDEEGGAGLTSALKTDGGENSGEERRRRGGDDE